MGGATLDIAFKNDVVERYNNMNGAPMRRERMHVHLQTNRGCDGYGEGRATSASACAAAGRVRGTNNGNLNNTRLYFW